MLCTLRSTEKLKHFKDQTKLKLNKNSVRSSKFITVTAKPGFKRQDTGMANGFEDITIHNDMKYYRHMGGKNL